MSSERVSILRSLLSALFWPEIRIWRGQESLSKVFWDYGIFGSAIIILFYAAAVLKGQIVTQQFLLACFVIFTAWFLISFWRCAAHAEPFWRSLTRWLVVPWTINTFLALMFLEIDLVATYLTP